MTMKNYWCRTPNIRTLAAGAARNAAGFAEIQQMAAAPSEGEGGSERVRWVSPLGNA